MKNELTAEEWLVLNEYITYSYIVLAMWHEQGVLKEKLKIFDRAKEKFNDTAKEIESHA